MVAWRSWRRIDSGGRNGYPRHPVLAALIVFFLLIASAAAALDFFGESGAPTAAVGADGDVYLDIDNGDLYRKSNGSWAVVNNLTGPPGPKGDKGDPGSGGTGASIAFAEVAMSGDVSAALQAAFDSDRIVTTSPGCGDVTTTLGLPSATVFHGVGSSRAGTDGNPTCTNTSTSLRVPAGALIDSCVIHRAEHGNGLDLRNFSIWGFGDVVAANRTGICVDGLGNRSTIDNVFIRNVTTGIRLADAVSDNAVAWYGSIRDVMLENIAGCGILIDGSFTPGGQGGQTNARGWAQLTIAGADLHDIDGPRICIRNIHSGSSILISGGTWSMDGFTQENVTAPAIDITNSPRINLKVEGVNYRGGAGDTFIRVDRDDYQITLDSNTLGASATDPANPDFCALAVDAPSADVPCGVAPSAADPKVDVPCGSPQALAGAACHSAVLINGRQPAWQ